MALIPKDLTDPRGPVLTAVKRLADAMFTLAESNRELAASLDRNGAPR